MTKCFLNLENWKGDVNNMWEENAKYVEQVYGAYVNWEERFYECPECGEPVYECDWLNDELCDFLCPICKFSEEEGEEDF